MYFPLNESGFPPTFLNYSKENGQSEHYCGPYENGNVGPKRKNVMIMG